MFQLRNYQTSIINQIYDSWVQYRRVLLQLPTGAGKTVIFSTIAAQFLRRGMKVLILAHRKELLTQAAKKVKAIATCCDGREN